VSFKERWEKMLFLWMIVYDWDRYYPDMSVGTHYPCMYDFRLAVRQHAIMNESELGTEKFDPTRFREYCSSEGCPWIIELGLNMIRVLGYFF
jgi:hypothetical protein